MSIHQKLLEVQKEIGTVKKTADNPFFKSKYFDINKLLEVVRPVLTKHGLVLLQPLDTIEGAAALTTIIAEAETGMELHFTTPIPTLADPQKMGSAVTYFRRYALTSILGLQAEDDDANAASGKVAPKKAAPKKKPAASSF